ncbi:hypothetical protein DOTSEDRAFT_120864 [Dothistroma septosporum NZE10]|uniref:Copper transport protein n=1 Tax=Dothistroma septosporum (strain NZE10 / CBS 128990) TaxID=675120 RepID=N1Q3R7_DOTSN|nr:hypothetical protein DOTSEDRAFT_120864 [Dothistroma septosporum NZE10]
MMMVFFTATDTPLYSMAWMPKSTGQYAGTCIFLILLAIVFRSLLAVRVNLASIAGAYAWKRDTHILRDKPRPGDKILPRRWSLNSALVWASMDTVLAGVSYLLMLAVMTMNVGYFLSILGGTFAGSFFVGRWTAAAGH